MGAALKKIVFFSASASKAGFGTLAYASKTGFGTLGKLLRSLLGGLFEAYDFPFLDSLCFFQCHGFPSGRV